MWLNLNIKKIASQESVTVSKSASKSWMKTDCVTTKSELIDVEKVITGA